MEDAIPPNNLSTLRTGREWRQADVGEYLGIGAVTVYRHEARLSSITPTMLIKYCRLYGVELSDIYTDVDTIS